MIFVTGATGFVGSRLVFDLIDKGYKVKALKRINSKIPDLLLPIQNKISWVYGDVLDKSSLNEAMEGVEFVFHCAAFVSLNQKKTEELYNININGTANIVNACLQNNIKKLLHISSIAALGASNFGELIDERNYWTDSQSAYSISKFFSENEVWRGAAEGLDIVVVNPAVIIGPNSNEFGSGRIIKLFRNGSIFYTSGGNAFIDVRDLSNCMIQLMYSEIKNERFIVSAGNFTYQELMNIASNITKNSPPRILISKSFLQIGYWIFKILSILFFIKSRVNQSNIDSATDKVYYNNKKIIQALNYKFLPIQKTISDSISS